MRNRGLKAVRYDGRSWVVECELCGQRFEVGVLSPAMRCPRIECEGAGNGPEMQREHAQGKKP